MAVAFLGAILKLQKRRSRKIKVDLKLQAEGHAVDQSGGKKWGFRLDNQWLQYAKAKVPNTADSWDRQIFVDKTHWGLYCWPESLQCYAPVEEQASLDRSREQIRDVNRLKYHYKFKLSFPVAINLI